MTFQGRETKRVRGSHCAAGHRRRRTRRRLRASDRAVLIRPSRRWSRWGWVRAKGKLRPIAEAETTGLHARTPAAVSRVFSAADQAGARHRRCCQSSRVASPVVIATKKLPTTSKDARPRIEMDLSHQGHTLSVLPTLVYGDPPIARVDGNSVVALGADVPMRRREEEREILPATARRAQFGTRQTRRSGRARRDAVRGQAS